MRTPFFCDHFSFFRFTVFEKPDLKCYIDAQDAVDVVKRPRLSVIPASK